MIRLRVRDLMTEGVFAVDANDHLATVSDLMYERSICMRRWWKRGGSSA